VNQLHRNLSETGTGDWNQIGRISVRSIIFAIDRVM
jgi:hypothetical protein